MLVPKLNILELEFFQAGIALLLKTMATPPEAFLPFLGGI